MNIKIYDGSLLSAFLLYP